MSELARQALSWITYAERPLTTGELCHALAVGIGDEDLDTDKVPEVEDLITVCAGLLTVDEASNVIRLVHYTTQEYFERTRGEWIPNAQLNIASACLTYLSFRPFRSGVCATSEEFESRIEHYGFLDYAARYWHKHALTIQEQLFDLALPFLQSSNLVSCSVEVNSATKMISGRYDRFFPTNVTGLHVAAGSGLLCLSEKLLLPSGGNANAMADSRDSNFQTPLSWAAQNGHEAVVKLLVERDDVEADSKNTKRWTPLCWAALNGHEAVAKVLLGREDVEADWKTADRQTPLLLAANHGHNAVVELLIEQENVDVNARDGFGQTPLMLAASSGHKAVVELLIKREDVDVNERGAYEQTTLLFAARMGRSAVVELLIEREDVDVNARDRYGQTPLLRAAAEGHSAVVELLIEREDTDVNSEDENGFSPLMCAAMEGHKDVVELLIKRDDVNVDATMVDGHTALELAQARNQETIVELLQSVAKKP